MTFNKYYIAILILFLTIYGCGTSPTLELPTGAKGYILHVSPKRTEVIIDYTKKDGISSGTILDVYRTGIEGMDDPVKIGEITVKDVGRKMSKAKVTAITSSLKMQSGDKITPHPVIVATDASWVTSRMLVEDWSLDTGTSDERIWTACEVIPPGKVNIKPEIRQLVADTDVKPIWHPSIKGRYGDLYFRKIFILDAEATTATLNVACGGRTNVYLNGKWIGEAEEWPEISRFNVRFLMESGRNLIAVHTVREPRTRHPSALFLALSVETQFQ